VTFDRSTRLNQDALKSLDASLAVNLIRGLALTVDGVNLTDEKIVQFARTVLFRRAALSALIEKRGALREERAPHRSGIGGGGGG